jgi:hypothetical protein
MSIYGTTVSFNADEHEEACAIYVETSPSVYEFSGRACNCGTPSAPLVYQGSHVLPSLGDERGGTFELAEIPSFIQRDGQENGEEGALKDFLRVDVDQHFDVLRVVPPQTVVLDRSQVEELRDYLSSWLEREPHDDG